MSTNKDRIDNAFHSKIMLFGEYSIIFGSMALTIPYSHYNGSLQFVNKNKSTYLDFAHRSNQQLREYYQQYLLPTGKKGKKGKLPVGFNHKLLGKEIDKGLYFESSIPEGYGLGSSGALVAALYDRYMPSEKKPPHPTTQPQDILKLKKDLAVLESWFHATSSGIDPLICYMQQPLLIKEGQSITQIDIPSYNLASDTAVFLINTGKARKTAPLVAQFMQDCENPEFKNSILNEYTPLNNSCIQSLIDADIERFTKDLRALSQFQATNFKRMIPSSIHEDWMYGLSSRKYMLKLCGAGGGGFVLGFTHHYGEVKERFLGRGVEVVTVWQIGAR